MSVPTIRPARESDVRSLAALSLRVWDEAYADIIAPAVLRRRHAEPASRREDRWYRRVAIESVWVAADGDALVGFARSTPASTVDVRGLLSLYIVRSRWRSGLGSRLLESSLADGPAHLWLFTGNISAVRFYETQRFVRDGQCRPDPPYGEELHLTRT